MNLHKTLYGTVFSTLVTLSCCLDTGALADSATNSEKVDITPLMVAVLNVPCDKHRVEYLLSHGSDPNVPNRTSGSYPVLEVARFGQSDCLDVLLRYGAKTNIVNAIGEDLLQEALVGDNQKIISTVLRIPGLDVNHLNIQNESAIFYAAAAGNPMVIRMLLEHGANVCLLDKRGESPADKARKKNHLEVIQFLLCKKVS